MNRLTDKGLVVLIGLALVVCIVSASSLARSDNEAKWRDRVPRCQEDSVLIGSGSFTHGRWSAYECGAAVDDYGVAK